jgi:hypothetical protein
MRRRKIGGKVKTQRSMTKRRKALKAARRRLASGKQTNVARLISERDEALEQLAAASEVLQVISSSPGKLEPVFEAMLQNALRICEAKFGHLLLYDGERFHATHLHDVHLSYREFWQQHDPIKPSPSTGLARLASTKQVVHIPDLKAESAYADVSRYAS